MGKRVKIGDIIQIQTGRGLAYAHYTHKLPEFGSVIRVIKGIYSQPQTNLLALVQQETQFHSLYALATSINQKHVEVIGNVPVPKEFQAIPKFKYAHIFPDPDDREKYLVRVYAIWDGTERRVNNSQLTEEEKGYSYHSYPTTGALIYDIEREWSPRKDPFERIVGDLKLCDGFEVLVEREQEEKRVSASASSIPNHNGEKITLSPHLPVKTVIIDISEGQKVCQETGQTLARTGEEVSLMLTHENDCYRLKEIIRPKYAHPKKVEGGMIMAELPHQLLTECRADESLLADIITKKFSEHYLPLDRIAKFMEWVGVGISHKLLSQWLVHVGMALKPLYDEMLNRIMTGNHIHIDETPVKLHQTDQVACMWDVVVGYESTPSYKIYQFKKNQLPDRGVAILKEYDGGLHSEVHPVCSESREAEAILISLVQTCQCLGIKPREYLEDIMRRVEGYSSQTVHELLPDEWLKSRNQTILP